MFGFSIINTGQVSGREEVRLEGCMRRDTQGNDEQRGMGSQC